MIDKNILLVYFILLFSIFNISIISAQIPGVYSTPTASPSPSPSPICSGIGTLDLRLADYMVPRRDIITGEIKEVLSTDFKDPENLASYEDFKACKVPASFSCPSGCSVEFRQAIQQIGSVSGTAGEKAINNIGVVKECNYDGTIRKYGIFNGGDLGNTMNAVTQEFSDKIKDAMKECECPTGSSQVVIATITGMSSIYLFGIWVGVEIYYKIDIKCIAESSTDATTPSGTTTFANLHLEKECKKIA